MRTALGEIIRYARLAWGFWLCLSLGCDGLPKLKPRLSSGGRKKTSLEGTVISRGHAGTVVAFSIKLGRLVSSLWWEPSGGLGCNVQGQAEASGLGCRNTTSTRVLWIWPLWGSVVCGSPQSWRSESQRVFFKNLSFQQTLISPEKSLTLRLKLYNP